LSRGVPRQTSVVAASAAMQAPKARKTPTAVMAGVKEIARQLTPPISHIFLLAPPAAFLTKRPNCETLVPQVGTWLEMGNSQFRR
jgi:hypothetical protein